MSYPNVQFKAGRYGEPYDNVNFARQKAEADAARTGKVTIVYQIYNGQAIELQKIRPKETA